MDSGMNKPIFKDSSFFIDGFDAKKFELKETAWKHVTQDRSRRYLERHFTKIEETLKNPDYILKSPQEHYVANYVKHYNDFYIYDTVTASAYLNILVNTNNNSIRTIYTSIKVKNWICIWQKK